MVFIILRIVSVSLIVFIWKEALSYKIEEEIDPVGEKT